MKGLIVTENHKLKLVHDIPTPEINEYEALVKVECCMICNGTDLEIINGKIREASKYPLVIGHESVGRIIKVGNNVKSFKVGDRILRPGLRDSKKYYSSWGGFAEYALVIDYESALGDEVEDEFISMGITQQIVPEGIAPQDAALMITLKETYSILNRITSQAKNNMLILGDGPVGLSLLTAAILQGLDKVVVVGNHPEKLEVAKKLGATEVYWNKDNEQMKAATLKYHREIDICFDTIGRNNTIEQCLGFLKSDGTLAVYGLKNDSEINFTAPELRNYKVQFTQWPNPEEEKKAHLPISNALINNRIDTSQFITDTFDIDNFEDGFKAIQNRKALKVVLTF